MLFPSVWIILTGLPALDDNLYKFFENSLI